MMDKIIDLSPVDIFPFFKVKNYCIKQNANRDILLRKIFYLKFESLDYNIQIIQLTYIYKVQMQKYCKNTKESIDEYKILKTLGSGYSAEVKLALDDKGHQVAIKQYKQETSTIESLIEQLNVMKELHHENIIKLISVRKQAIYKKGQDVRKKCFAIVLEYAAGGELFDFVAETGRFSEKVTRYYFIQIMSGIHHMHDKGYAHRDIKPQNLLLSSDFALKIADFGFSCLLRGKTGTGILRTRLGTQGYMAPQISEKHYDGKKTDIFATGVILFIMYAGNPPFERPGANDPYFALLKDKKFNIFWQAHSRKRTPGFFSDTFKSLFEHMVAFKPQQRFSYLDIMKHPWLKGPVSTKQQIFQQFASRKKKLDKILEEKRITVQQEHEKRTQSISTQGHSSRGTGENDQNEFLSIYNKQLCRGRKLLPLQTFLQSDDILVKQANVPLAVTNLKYFLKTHEVLASQQAEQESLEVDETDKLRCKEIKDQQNVIQATYEFSYKIDENIICSHLVFDIHLGLDEESKQIHFHFNLVEGSQFYYKKIIKDIKISCFP